MVIDTIEKYDYIKNTIVDLYNEHLQIISLVNTEGKQRFLNGKIVETITKTICKLLNPSVLIDKTPKRIFSQHSFIDEAVDLHVNLGDKTLYIECKSYLDKCYMDRANSDFRKLKTDKDYSAIVAFEDSIDINSYNFFMDDGIIDNVFFLMDGKRNSKNPSWVSGKSINENKLLELIKYIDSIIN